MTTMMQRIEKRMRRVGLLWSDWDEKERFAAALKYGADLDLHGFDSFLKKPGIWSDRVGKANRSTLLNLRTDAVTAFKTGNVDLAVMTARLAFCEARHIGLQIYAHPMAKLKKESRTRAAKAQKKSANAQRQKTAAKLNLESYNKAVADLRSKYGKSPLKKQIASELCVSLPTLNNWLKQNIES